MILLIIAIILIIVAVLVLPFVKSNRKTRNLLTVLEIIFLVAGIVLYALTLLNIKV